MHPDGIKHTPYESYRTSKTYYFEKSQIQVEK